VENQIPANPATGIHVMAVYRVGRLRELFAANEKQLAAWKCDELIDF